MPARRLDRKSYLEPSASRPEMPSLFSLAATLRAARRGPHSFLKRRRRPERTSHADTQSLEPMRILLATTNPHKVKEIRELLTGLPVDLTTLARWPDVAAPEETGATFEENARTKARYYAEATGELTVAEDSGLEIDALGGAPGVESARFGGASTGYPEKFALIYGRLRALGQIDSAARFVCALALADGRDARS